MHRIFRVIQSIPYQLGKDSQLIGKVFPYFMGTNSQNIREYFPTIYGTKEPYNESKQRMLDFIYSIPVSGTL